MRRGVQRRNLRQGVGGGVEKRSGGGWKRGWRDLGFGEWRENLEVLRLSWMYEKGSDEGDERWDS